MKKYQQLSRSEMKNVLGGNVPVGFGLCSFGGTCASYPGIIYDPDNTPGANDAQGRADSFCLQNDCCTSADCPGAIA